MVKIYIKGTCLERSLQVDVTFLFALGPQEPARRLSLLGARAHISTGVQVRTGARKHAGSTGAGTAARYEATTEAPVRALPLVVRG